MNWWLLIPAVPAYLGVGLGLARVAFIGVLSDSPRFEVDKCNPRHCNHLKVITIDDKRHYFTGRHLSARSWARWTFVGWPLLIVGAIGWGIWQVVTGGYGMAVYRPTRAEKQTQRQRDLAALSTKAKELGLPVPAEWGQKEDHLGPRAREWADRLYRDAAPRRHSDPQVMEEIDAIADEINESKIRNRYGKPIWIDEPS